LGIVLAPWLLRAIAPGFTSDPAQEALAVQLTRVMFPYLLLVGLAALGMGALNAENRFFAGAFGPAVSNIGMIAGVLLLARHVDPPILALASAALRALSRQAAAGDRRALGGTLNFALRLAVYICIPATIGLLVLRAPITRVLFERGRFTSADTVATAEALSGYAVGLVA